MEAGHGEGGGKERKEKDCVRQENALIMRTLASNRFGPSLNLHNPNLTYTACNCFSTQ